MKKMHGDLQFTSIFLPLLITVCSLLPIFTLTGSVSAGRVLLGQGSPCSGQGGGRPGWCPRASAGPHAPAPLPCSWGRHSHPVQLGTHCSSSCPAPWCTAPPARKSPPSAASAQPCRDGATCASAHWSVSLCCCTEGLGSASQVLVGREGLINGKCVLEFTLN